MAKKRKRKPKYYLTPSWWGGWWGIHQRSNNVIVAIVPDEAMAQVILDFLNNLPHSVLPKIYAEQRRKRESEE